MNHCAFFFTAYSHHNSLYPFGPTKAFPPSPPPVRNPISRNYRKYCHWGFGYPGQQN